MNRNETENLYSFYFDERFTINSNCLGAQTPPTRYPAGGRIWLERKAHGQKDTDRDGLPVQLGLGYHRREKPTLEFKRRSARLTGK